jgi:DNA-binding NtrC family response regulator
MRAKVLLLSTSDETSWIKTLADAVEPFGLVCLGIRDHERDDVDHGRYDLIVVDASVVSDVPATIRQIQKRQPFAAIVVAGVAPSWRVARDAFRAGAADYIEKSFDSAQVRSELREHLPIVMVEH